MTLAQYDTELLSAPKLDTIFGELVSSNSRSYTYLVVRGVCGFNVPIVHPQNRALSGWVFLGMICIIYEAMVTPVRVAFKQEAEGNLYMLENLLTLYFLMDFILQFFIGYYDNMSRLVCEHKKIVKQYVTSWCLIDFIASFPVEWVRLAVSVQSLAYAILVRAVFVSVYRDLYTGIPVYRYTGNLSFGRSVLDCIEADFCN